VIPLYTSDMNKKYIPIIKGEQTPVNVNKNSTIVRLLLFFFISHGITYVIITVSTAGESVKKNACLPSVG